MKFHDCVIKDSEEKILISKLNPDLPFESFQKTAVSEKKLLIVDCETTGLNAQTDSIIEIAILVFNYCVQSGHLISEVTRYESFQDPGFPISDEITKITGITNELVKGHHINWDYIETITRDCDYIIAHNSDFDKSFIGLKSQSLKHKKWLCSLNLIPWEDFGYSTKKLENLCVQHGFYFKSHRALNDIYALGMLLNLKAMENKSYLNIMLEKANDEYCLVSACFAPFEKKDLLKNRGYRWDVQDKVWKKKLPTTVVAEEETWLKSQIYQKNYRAQVELLAP